MTNEEAEKKVWHLSMPHAFRRFSEIREKGTRFAHYTSAYAALQIIEKQNVWMRNAVVMNDFSEVQHGQECLAESWRDEKVGGRLQALLNSLQEGLAQSVADEFDSRLHDREVQSYLISISEHGDSLLDEDKHGRLSMWRAYGGNTNVAFVFKNTPFVSESDALNAFTSPVLYCNKEGFKAHFQEMVEGLEDHISLLEQVGPVKVAQTLVAAFHFAALSTKHPGFAEEREWRVIYSPTLFYSNRINFDIETIEGVPQRVYKLKMENYPDENFVGATLPELLEKIIIGPTQSPWPIYDALTTKLLEKGVVDAFSKVQISDIPLRR